jgi:hypothetical protein
MAGTQETNGAEQVEQLATVLLSSICTDGDTQARHETSEDAVRDYTWLYSQSKQHGTKCPLPALKAVFDGRVYWLYDGFQRYEAAGKAGLDSVPVAFVRGTPEDARWFACAANKEHRGERRTNDDISKAIRMALKHPRAATMSNYEIAEHVGVVEGTIRYAKKKLDWATTEVPQSGVIIDRNGRRMNVANIGKAGVANDQPTTQVTQWDETPAASASTQVTQMREEEDEPAPPSEEVKGEDLPADEDARQFDERRHALDAQQKRIKRTRDEYAKHVKEAVYDGRGEEVPTCLRDLFASPALPDLIARVDQIAGLAKELQQAAVAFYKIYPYVRIDDYLKHVKAGCEEFADAGQALEDGKPHAPCPQCQGAMSKCDGCRNSGCVPLWRWRALTDYYGQE